MSKVPRTSHFGSCTIHYVRTSELSKAQLQRLLTVGRSLVAELDVDAVLEQVLEAARDLSGAGYAALGSDDERPPGANVLSAAVTIRGQALGNIYLTGKNDGAEFDSADEEMLVVLADWAAVAIENARLYEGAEQRRSELERAVVGLQATASLESELSGVTDIDRVLTMVVKHALALVRARVVAVLLEREDQLVVVEVAGEVDPDPRGHGLTLSEESASVLPDAFSHRDTRRVAGPDPIVEATLEIPHSEMLIAPLGYGGEAQGLLVAFDTTSGRPFRPDDALLLTSFAASASTAIATAQSVEHEKLRLSIESSEKERKRWAMELHDETLQELGALKMMSESALNRDEAGLTRQLMERSIKQLERTIESLEGLITELRPATLDELGVRPALDALIARIADANGLSVSTRIDLAYDGGRAPTRLAPELEATLYRLVQEALNNVVKHAGAAEVEINISEGADALRVRVQDDGAGFDPSAVTGRFGLMGMRERVELAGGELEVSSRPGQGTRVIARLPAERADAANSAAPGS